MIPELPDDQELARHGAGSLGGALPGLAEGLHDSEFSLLELADRLLHRGVVLVGEATISVAGIDLIYLGLNVVLTSVENLLPRNPENPEDEAGRTDGW